jgi:hypothetical protein
MTTGTTASPPGNEPQSRPAIEDMVASPLVMPLFPHTTARLPGGGRRSWLTQRIYEPGPFAGGSRPRSAAGLFRRPASRRVPTMASAPE